MRRAGLSESAELLVLNLVTGIKAVNGLRLNFRILREVRNAHFVVRAAAARTVRTFYPRDAERGVFATATWLAG